MTVRRLPLALSLSCALMALGSATAIAQSAPGSLGELSAVQSLQSVQVPAANIPGVPPATVGLPGSPLDASAVSPPGAPPAVLMAPTASPPVLSVPGAVSSPEVSPVPGLASIPAPLDHDQTVRPISSDAQRLLNAQNEPDESTLLRIVGKGQARLTLMDLASKIETDRIKIDTARMDYEKKKREAATDNDGGGTSSSGAAGNHAGGSSRAGTAVPVALAPPVFQPSVRSIFSFGSSAVAQVFVSPGQSIPVHAGDTLPDGTKVLSVSDSAVTVRKPHSSRSFALARSTTSDGSPTAPIVSLAPQPGAVQSRPSGPSPAPPIQR